jgi:hypothetical protein
MASSGKRKTTMAKLNREQRMRERQMQKQARKDARKLEGPVDWAVEVARRDEEHQEQSTTE